MPLNFDVAIFGEKGTEHGLLQTTNESGPRGLVVHTDLPIDLPESEGNQPMLAGFVLDGRYVFTSTVRDSQAKRAGMARTVALFLPTADVCALEELSLVVDELVRLQHADSSIEPVVLKSSIAKKVDSNIELSTSVVFDALATEDITLPIVWGGIAGFTAMVEQLWKILPVKARAQFQFRTACRPFEGANRGFDLVCTPIARVSRWQGYHIIQPPFMQTELPSKASPLLSAGNRKSIYAFADEIGVSLEHLGMLPAVTRCYSSYVELSEASDLDVTTLFRTIARLSPKQTVGAKIKKKVCNALVSRVKAGPLETLKFLRNLSVDAYTDGVSEISTACESRFSDLLRASSPGLPQLVRGAISTPRLPWSQGVLRATVKALTDCVPAATQVVVDLFGDLSDERVMGWIETAIPMATNLEDSLLLHCAENVCGNVSNELLALCRRHNWARLHARAGCKLLEPTALLRQQASMIQSLTLGAAELSSQLGNDRFATEAAKTDEKVYWDQVVDDCQQDGTLFSQFDFRLKCWRYVVAQFVAQSLALPESMPAFTKKVEASWDAIARRDLSDMEYMHALANSSCAGILMVPGRVLLWDQLSYNDCAVVLSATAQQWFTKAMPVSRKAESLEAPLRAEILANQHREKLLPVEGQGCLTQAFDTFRAFGELDERDFAEFRVRFLTKNMCLTESDSFRLGEFVNRRGWHRLAVALLDDHKRYRRNDLLPAIRACRDQYGWLTCVMNGISESEIPEDAWWSEAIDVLSEAYPAGPFDKSLWSRAGGARWELSNDGSGKEKWTKAIELLRRSRGSSELKIGSLLWQARDDGPRDDELNALIEHCPFDLDLSRHEPFVD
jgi:hypothetical protein